MTPEEKRREERARERRNINTYAPLEALEKIAKDHVPALSGRQGGLDTMDSDELDYFTVSVWGLKEALIEAYRLGEMRAIASAQRQISKLEKRLKVAKRQMRTVLRTAIIGGLQNAKTEKDLDATADLADDAVVAGLITQEEVDAWWDDFAPPVES